MSADWAGVRPPPAPDEIVFQGLLHPDGTPYGADEVELIRARARPGR